MAYRFQVYLLESERKYKKHNIVLLKGKKTCCNSQMHVPYQPFKCHCTHKSPLSHVIKGCEMNLPLVNSGILVIEEVIKHIPP